MSYANPGNLVVLIGCTDEWMCRSLETVFAEKKYEVTRTGSGKQALQHARRRRYDVLLLDEHLDDLNGIEVTVALRDDPLFDHATPIVIISSSHSTLPSRLNAYAAGAWEYCHLPLDVDGLFFKLGTFLRARQELAASQANSLTDPSSGVYTAFGLHQLGEQLEARAVRNHEAFACLAFTPEADGRESGKRATTEELESFVDVAHVLRVQARKSDVVAKTGDSELAILAPDTDAVGARLLVERLQRELAAASKHAAHPQSFRLRAGYCAVPDLAAANVDVNELVRRANSALAHVPAAGKAGTVVSFDDLPTA
ncbi:MAG TPA: response regulator [Gemmatimonadaceae bacterium]|jgi:PleD family two-component response regulator|nr:response regulator [Gemmatimonadaceae bacterium]